MFRPQEPRIRPALISMPLPAGITHQLKITVGCDDGKAWMSVNGMPPDADIIIPDGNSVDVDLTVGPVTHLTISRRGA